MSNYTGTPITTKAADLTAGDIFFIRNAAGFLTIVTVVRVVPVLNGKAVRIEVVDNYDRRSRIIRHPDSTIEVESH